MQFDADKDGKLSAEELGKFIADFAQEHGSRNEIGNQRQRPANEEGQRAGRGRPDNGRAAGRPQR